MPDPLKLSLSATEVPALYDASPYCTMWSLYQKFANGVEIEREADARMTAGKRLEAALLEWAAEDLRLEVIPNIGTDGKQAYVRNGLIGCTRDATIIAPDLGPGALEIKLVNDYKIWMTKWGGGKSPPREIETQLQTQMQVGAGDVPYRWGKIAAFCGGQMFYYDRAPALEIWKETLVRTEQFFEDVKNRNEPDPFGLPVEQALLTRCFPIDEKKILDMSEETADNIEMAELVRMAAWHGAERLGHERAEKDIKAKMQGLAKGAASIALPRGIRADLKQQSRKAYSVKESTFTVVSFYVPEHLQTGDLVSFDD